MLFCDCWEMKIQSYYISLLQINNHFRLIINALTKNIIMQKYETIKNLGLIFYQKTKDFVLTYYALNIFLIRIPYFSTIPIHPPLHRFSNFSRSLHQPISHLICSQNSTTAFISYPTYIELYFVIFQQSQKCIFIFRFVIFYALKNLQSYYFNVSSNTYIIVFSLLSSSQEQKVQKVVKLVIFCPRFQEFKNIFKDSKIK